MKKSTVGVKNLIFPMKKEFFPEKKSSGGIADSPCQRTSTSRKARRGAGFQAYAETCASASRFIEHFFQPSSTNWRR